MSAIEVGNQFIQELSSALKRIDTPDAETAQFMQTLLNAFQQGKLTYDPQSLRSNFVLPDWFNHLADNPAKSAAKVQDAALKLHPFLNWWTWDAFYPDEKYSDMADRTLGAVVVGSKETSFSPEEVTFTAEERYQFLFGGMDTGWLYPLHKHKMAELYFVIAGEAEFSHDGVMWHKRPAGSVFYNRSFQPHAIRTEEHAVLFASLYLPPFEWISTMIE